MGAIHELVRRAAPTLSLVLVVLGLAAFAAIAVLSLLLVTGVLTFEEQIGPVSIAYLGLGAWLVATGHLGSRAGTIPNGARWGLFAALYVGYPFWAVRTSRLIIRPLVAPGNERLVDCAAWQGGSDMYTWLVALHLVGFALFIAMHGVSMWVAFRIRGEPNRDVVAALLGLSSRGNQVMYLGFLLLGIGGLGAAAQAGWLTAGWVVASYVVLTVVILLMYMIGAGFYYPLREGLEGTEKTPRLDDAELAVRLQNRRPETLALIAERGC